MIEMKIISLAWKFWNFMMCSGTDFCIHFVGPLMTSSNLKMHIFQLWKILIPSFLLFLISLSRSMLYCCTVCDLHAVYNWCSDKQLTYRWTHWNDAHLTFFPSLFAHLSESVLQHFLSRYSIAFLLAKSLFLSECLFFRVSFSVLHT